MTTHKLRRRLGDFSQQDFAIEFGVPLSTVKNWDSRNCMPEYVYYAFYRLIIFRQQFYDLYACIRRNENIGIHLQDLPDFMYVEKDKDKGE